MKKDKEGINSIKLVVYFHTGDGKLHLPQKTAFKAGVVTMPTNHKQGIRASEIGNHYFGDSQGSVMSAIKSCLKKAEVNLIEKDKVTEYKRFLKMKDEGKFFDENYNI
jgi:hypothetical protein